MQRTAGDEPKYGQQCEHRIHPAAPVGRSPRHEVLYARAPEQRPMAGRRGRVAGGAATALSWTRHYNSLTRLPRPPQTCFQQPWWPLQTGWNRPATRSARPV